jgi:hypothetical protein
MGLQEHMPNAGRFINFSCGQQASPFRLHFVKSRDITAGTVVFTAEFQFKLSYISVFCHSIDHRQTDASKRATTSSFELKMGKAWDLGGTLICNTNFWACRWQSLIEMGLGLWLPRWHHERLARL